MSKNKSIRTIEEAVEQLKERIFDRLENGDNTLSDIETIARVINSIALTQEHVALTRQAERYTNAEPIELGSGITVKINGASEDAPDIKLNEKEDVIL